jgi:hypothetical protein
MDLVTTFLLSLELKNNTIHMKKNPYLVLLGIFLLVSAVMYSCSDTPNSEVEEVDDPVKTSELSPVLPFDVNVKGPNPVWETTVLHDFDLFSWQSFVALNWSLNQNEMIGVNGDNPTVWESWKNVYDVFLPNGEQPSPWGTPGVLPPGCQDSEGRLLIQVGKTPDLLTASEQPFKTGPLIDQNGLYTRFEILINEEMFDYINGNDLYSFDGQQTFGKEAAFPEGVNADKKKKTDGKWGAIMVKAAWKVMGENDDASKFHTVDAVVYTPASTNPVVEESCKVQKVGLVGLHIGTKTKTCPQWIWSTFEHVDNAPTFGTDADKAHYNYFKKGSQTPINTSPERPWDPDRAGQTPTQVERLVAINPVTEELNKKFQQLFRDVNEKSVWQYYQLVGTQWPVDPEVEPLGNPFPLFLGNSTLETYIQGIVRDDKVELVPNVSSSCMHCHNGATMISTGKASDFTFILERAK